MHLVWNKTYTTTTTTITNICIFLADNFVQKSKRKQK